MKKTIGIISLLVFYTLHAFAQELPNATSTEKKYKFFAALTGGPSMPVGPFGSSSVTSSSSESGFAEFGYNINLHTGYQFGTNYGLASTIFYSRYKLDVAALTKLFQDVLPPNTSIGADHWQYYGILAGPMGTVALTRNVSLDVKVLAGIARANFPVFEFANTQSQEKWTNAFAWQSGTNLRYNFTPKACFFTNLDYNFMKPVWKLSDTTDGLGQTTDVEQKMGVIDLSVGLGINL